MQIYGLRFGCLILFSKSTIQRICELDGFSFQIFRGKFYDVWFEIEIPVHLRFFFGVIFHQNYRFYCGLLKLLPKPGNCRLWKDAGLTLVLRFFSAYAFFNFFFVICRICSGIYVFFRLFSLPSSTVYWEACKLKYLLWTGLSFFTPSRLYKWLVFTCYFWCKCFLLASFFKVVFLEDC